jgi:FtsZ-binding cell division protein ZapB
LGQRLEQIEAHQNAIDVLQMELEELRKGKHLNTYSKVKSYYFSVEQ